MFVPKLYHQIVVVAKKFASLLDQAAYEDADEEVCVGRVFLTLSEELCQTYKVYCANHSITVEPLMKKVSVGCKYGLCLVFVDFLIFCFLCKPLEFVCTFVVLLPGEVISLKRR